MFSVNKNWEVIRLVNEKYLSIPPHVSDYIAIQDILRLCTFGLSNKTISERLQMQVGYIQDTLKHYFEFEGWDETLDFNPYFIYERATKKFNLYKNEIETVSATHNFDFILASFMICRIYDEIEETVNNYYNKEEGND